MITLNGDLEVLALVAVEASYMIRQWLPRPCPESIEDVVQLEMAETEG